MADTLFEFDIAPKVSSPKLFELSTVSAHSACNLNSRWHSRVPLIDPSNVTRNTHYVCYVARYESVAYAVAIWSSPIAGNRLKDGKKLLELRRLAINEDAPKNTATWMLSKMTKDIKKRFPNVIRLISYQDTDVHFGTIYKAANWTSVCRSELNDWNNRDRSAAQTTSPKIRWEYQL